MEALIGGRPRTSWLTAIVGPRRHIVRRHRRVMSGRRKATVLLKLGSSSGSGVHVGSEQFAPGIEPLFIRK